MAEMEQRITAIEARLSTVERNGAVEAVHRDNVEKRLFSIEDTLKWLVRLIFGGMLMGVVAYALGGGFNLG